MKAALAVVIAAASLVVLQAQEIYKVGDGVLAPVPIKQVRPDYTAEAKAARIEGVVELRVVVLADGMVRDVTVTKSLDSVLGLDKQAVNAAKEWLFKPATKDGKPVAVSVTLQMKFTLQ
jgi:periplasmic protein TonB